MSAAAAEIRPPTRPEAPGRDGRDLTEAEVEYLNSQPLGRIATVGANGAPHVTPVGVFYDPETEAIVIGGAADMASRKKFRDAQRRPDVAVVSGVRAR